MGDYNINNAPLVNPYKVLTRLLNIFYTNIAWAIRNSPKYLKDLNITGTFQQLSIYIAFLTSIKNSLQAIYSKGQAIKSQLKKA
jgi:hypothetical protein